MAERMGFPIAAADVPSGNLNVPARAVLSILSVVACTLARGRVVAAVLVHFLALAAGCGVVGASFGAGTLAAVHITGAAVGAMLTHLAAGYRTPPFAAGLFAAARAVAAHLATAFDALAQLVAETGIMHAFAEALAGAGREAVAA
jgi:hypothetical protein